MVSWAPTDRLLAIWAQTLYVSNLVHVYEDPRDLRLVICSFSVAANQSAIGISPQVDQSLDLFFAISALDPQALPLSILFWPINDVPAGYQMRSGYRWRY